MMGRFNIVKMSILLKVIHFHCNSYQFSDSLIFIYLTTGKAYSQNHLELQRILNNKKKFEKEEHIWKTYTSSFKNTTVIKTVWYWHILGYTNQCSRVASLGKKKILTYMISLFSARTSTPFSGGKNSLFNRLCWENWISTYKKLTLDPSLTYNKKWTPSGPEP